MGYEAFVLSDDVRELLLRRFPPSFPDVIAHHITNRFDVQRKENRPFGNVYAFEVVGIAQTDGLEALVVSRSGSTIRPDGKHYHITWSLDRSKGFKPADSNKVIEQGWQRIFSPYGFATTFEYIE